MDNRRNGIGDNFDNNFDIEIGKNRSRSNEDFDIAKYNVYRNSDDNDIYNGVDNYKKPNSSDDFDYFGISVPKNTQNQKKEIPTVYEDIYSGAPMEDIWSSNDAQDDYRNRTVPDDELPKSRSNGSRPPKNDKKKKNGSKKLWTIVTSLLLVLALVCTGGYFGVKKYLDLNTADLNTEDLGVNKEIKNKYADKQIINIALFGLDTRDPNSFEGHSDAIKIVSINQKTAEVKLITVLRDSEVLIEGHGKEKITHAYGYGGAELAIKTLNQNFGLDITEYATVNFLKLGELIDLVDGIDIEITEAERKETNNIANSEGISVPYIKKSGMVHMSGAQASAFVRIRHGDSDNARTERQQKVMGCLLKKAQTMSPAKYPKLIKEGLKLVETSMDYSDIMSLVPMISKNLTITQLSVPDEKAYKVRGGKYGKGGLWVWQYDLDDATQAIHEYIYETDTTQTTEPAQ